MRFRATAFASACLLAQAQGLYNNVDKPGDDICPRIEIDKEPGLVFGHAGVGGTTRGHAGADFIGLAHHLTWHAAFPAGKRKDATAFSAYGEDGKPVSLVGLKGKFVVVAFWSRRCDPAMKMLMELAQLYARKEKFGFEVLAVNFDSSRLPDGQPTPGGWSAIRTFQIENQGFLKEHPMPFYVPGTGAEGASVFLDSLDSMPVLCLVDKEGRLASLDVGYSSQLTAKRLSELIREEQARKGGRP